MNLNKTINELKNRFEKANWEEISLNLKTTGDKITIVPCCQTTKVSAETAEYFLVYGPAYADCLSACSIEQLAQNLIDSAQFKTDHEEGAQKLLDYYHMWIENGNYTEEQWEWYSDWYKEIHGVRPKR